MKLLQPMKRINQANGKYYIQEQGELGIWENVLAPSGMGMQEVVFNNRELADRYLKEQPKTMMWTVEGFIF